MIFKTLFVLNSVLRVFFGAIFYFENLHAYLVFKAWRETQAIFCRVRVAKTLAPSVHTINYPAMQTCKFYFKLDSSYCNTNFLRQTKYILGFLNIRKRGVFIMFCFCDLVKLGSLTIQLRGRIFRHEATYPWKRKKGSIDIVSRGPNLNISIIPFIRLIPMIHQWRRTGRKPIVHVFFWMGPDFDLGIAIILLNILCDLISSCV